MAKYLRKAANIKDKSKQAEKQKPRGNWDNAMKEKFLKNFNYSMNVLDEVKEYMYPWSTNKNTLMEDKSWKISLKKGKKINRKWRRW